MPGMENAAAPACPPVKASASMIRPGTRINIGHSKPAPINDITPSPIRIEANTTRPE
jgi:hypothetical protein